MTFAINRESFPDTSEDDPIPISTTFGCEFDNRQNYIDHMERTIIENGGRVVESHHKSHYIINDDGYDPKIWEKVGMLDQHNRKVIHFRWVLKCIETNEILEESDKMHLLPFPMKVPIPQFSEVSITLTCFDKPDREIFECMVKMYGFARNSVEKCTHIVVA